MTADPTGRRFHLRGPHSSAEITQVGAALRALTVDGVDLVPRYPDDLPTPAASGVVLVPWPNRIRDGKYTFGGDDLQLAISEPKFGNASHGLLRFGTYQAVEHTEERLVLGADVVPQTGYPFHLRTLVTYQLEADGLRVTHDIENVGATAAPVALGVHPYLQIGGVPTEDLVIHSTGTTTLVLDERNIPVDEVPVGPGTDLRAGVRLGDAALDNGYRGMDRDAAGHATHTLTSPDGRRLTLWQDEGFRWAQVFTTDRYPGHPLAVAIEPMTAPANAFATGIDLETVEPGARMTRNWGITFA
ncbi:aldose 1-epimerase family protein [Microbacterium testaceum]|uniref:aldose 1-epimerase family protein n=1 Tax=Microbacterium testaceum TaxID=2033 RepID=UPI001243A349|nr:aldose 1-epimerase family protein [Microbacterium testaceum]